MIRRATRSDRSDIGRRRRAAHRPRVVTDPDLSRPGGGRPVAGPAARAVGLRAGRRRRDPPGRGGGGGPGRPAAGRPADRRVQPEADRAVSAGARLRRCRRGGARRRRPDRGTVRAGRWGIGLVTGALVPHSAAAARFGHYRRTRKFSGLRDSSRTRGVAPPVHKAAVDDVPASCSATRPLVGAGRSDRCCPAHRRDGPLPPRSGRGRSRWPCHAA